MSALRYPIVIVFMVLVAHAGDLWRLAAGREDSGGAGSTRSDGGRVILVVADGLRWQEVFRGADSALLFSRAVRGDRAAVRERFWHADLHERRRALMPFVWNTIARRGQLYGNRDAGSAARVTNPMKFSYPGYNEMLVGAPDARIDRNDFGPNPNVTVFEWLNRQRDFRGRVAVAGTWKVFRDIFNVRRSRLRVEVPGSDAGTHRAALRLLEERGPRALFVGYGETDDVAHKGRYDLTLQAAHAIDRYVAELWERTQSMPAYRGRTTIILVADHGRGRAEHWTDHGARVPGSDETWFAVLGPGVAASGQSHHGEVTLAQAAASVASAVGLDYLGAAPRAAPPLPALAVRRQERQVVRLR